ncbi:uncharacterized protein LOC135389668 [Ornithodoros turicata]|uniref:uncharacterized protein LOC135389668 n=1 Tax=Ornithodoros turicata TaxID=34597 RepID=UPI003138BE97
MVKYFSSSTIGGGKRPLTEVSKPNEQSFMSKYIVLSSTSSEEEKRVPLGKMSPFFIEKAVSSLSKNITEIKKLRSDDLLIKCTSEADCKKILNTREMLDVPISASLHKTLNTCRGVVAIAELMMDVPVEEILMNLKEQAVIDVGKLKIRKNNEYITTRNVVPTFDRPSLPDKLKVGYLFADVRPYIPNPLRCFKCNRFGHAADACRGSPCCARFGQQGHDTKECRGPDCCVNCTSDHPSYSRSCPKWKLEKEILRIKVPENISYPEARKRVSPFITQKSFSAVLQQKPKMVIVHTQTDTPPRTQLSSEDGVKIKPHDENTVVTAKAVLPLSSPSMEAGPMECDDNSSSELSLRSPFLTPARGNLSRSGSLPEISEKDLAEARRKPRKPRITPPQRSKT